MGRPFKPHLPKDLHEILLLIGANLRTLRTELNLTQAEVAKRSKVSVTTISDLESKCARDVRISTLVSLGQTLNCDVGQLLVGSDIKLSNKDHSRLLRASEDILKVISRIQPD